jgi:hypothetical protein
MSYTPNLTPAELAYRSTLLGPTDSVAGDDAKLWLPIWSGEVLHAYDEYKSFEPMVTAKSISSGREMEFPITGTVDLQPAWAAGEYLVGGEDATAGNFAVSLDNRPMAAHFELDNIDLMITQWEYRQELARQAGQTLANARDKQIGAFLAGAATVELTAADPRTGLTLPAPAVTTGGADAAEALEILEAIEDFIVDCQENNVPVGASYCAVTPRIFQQIRRLGVAESQAQASSMQPMFGGVAMAGGLGAPLQQGMANLDDKLVYMGVTICKSNHLPTSDYAAAGNEIGEARYNVDGAAAGVRGLIWMPEAVASIRKTGLVVDTEDDIRRNTTFTVASMLSGTGILKPELSKVIVDGTVSGTGAAGAVLRSDINGALVSGGSTFGYANA